MSERHPILACGCAASATRAGVPSCPIHGTTELAPEQPDLTGRTARCMCGKTEPSDKDRLAFFEYRGEGSRSAAVTCKRCGYHEVAHTKPDLGAKHPAQGHEFEARGAFDFDHYYCGCRGWG